MILCVFVLCAGSALLYLSLSGSLSPVSAPKVDTRPALAAVETLQSTLDEHSGAQTVEIEARALRAGTFSVHAKATLGILGIPDTMTCEVFSRESRKKLLSETTEKTEAEWTLTATERALNIVVTATTKSGQPCTQELSFDNSGAGRFIWPIELSVKPLVHDFYLVKSGQKSFSGLTHNNGKMRTRHYVQIRGREHFGFDITAPSKTKILATAAGKVILAGSSSSDGTDSSDYGKYMILAHTEKYEGQAVYSLYAHLTSFEAKQGDMVEQGDVIALSGNTGGSRIPHCHLEFRIGANKHANNIDPLELLPERDFDSLPDSLTRDEGYAVSSVELYKSVRDKQWDFIVKAKTRVAITSGDVTIPAGTVVTLTNRTKSAATVSYQGKTISCKLRDLVYTY